MAECGCRWFYIALAIIGVVIILLVSHDPVKPNSAEDTLVKVSVYFRHGHRSPLYTFPTDKYKFNETQYWPQGPKELTKQGMREMYQLGKLLRMRYYRLFPYGYRENLVKAYSTYAPRSQSSCQLVLAGMFPARDNYKWSNEISWQPVPVWTSQVAYVKYQQEKTCPKFNAEVIRETAGGQELLAAENDTFKYLRDHTGLPLDQLCDVFIIWDTFKSQSAQGYRLPDWSKTIYPEKLTELVTECYRIQSIKSLIQLQLGASPWLNDLKNQLISNSSTIFSIHSGHDFILTFLLSGLGYEIVMPHPSGTIIVELHFINREYIVKFFYLEDISFTNPNQLNMHMCPNPCHLKELETFINHFVPTDYDEACKI